MTSRIGAGMLAVATAGLMYATVPAVAAGKPGATDLPLIVTLRNQTGDGVQSDGDAYRSGDQNVRAVLVANDNGNFVFDTNDNSRIDGSRRLVLNFGSQPVPNGLASSFSVDTFLGTLITSTSDDLRAMVLNQVMYRRGPIGWTDGSLGYAVRFSGLDGSGVLAFTCTAVDATHYCSNWTVAPTGPAVLDSMPTKGSSTRTIYGTYNMPFEMYLSKK